MQLIYRTLLEVEIRHDYFLLPGAITKYTEDYDVAKLFSITPSEQTANLLRDHKMMFKVTRTGFMILVQAEFVSAAIGYASLIDADATMSFSFYWTLRDNCFVNYTNQRLTEPANKIYYFSNRTSSQQAGITYLNKTIPAFGVTYPDTVEYHLGDIVSQGGQTVEMINMVSPAINFPGNAASWQLINPAVVNYVNPFDRINWQSSVYNHQRANTTPGEFITYQLFNVDGILVDMDLNTGMNHLQSEYRAPMVAGDPVNHTIDLSRLKPGVYSLQINETGGPTIISCYLLKKTIQPYLFAVSEFFVAGAAAPFQFIINNTVIKRWVLNDPAKKFLVRFRNRLTRWKYLKQDQTVFHQAPAPRPLSKTFSNYSIVVGGNTINLPDPAVNPIVPEVDVPTKLLKNIFSQIFLNH